MFSVVQKNTNFYSEFHVHLLCEFHVMLDYDEMKCNLVSEFFFINILKCIFCLYAIIINLMLE